MFLFIYHIPVLSGLGIVLTAARLFGIGNIPAVALLPLTLLLFSAPWPNLRWACCWVGSNGAARGT